jgi:hypothetical protein
VHAGLGGYLALEQQLLSICKHIFASHAPFAHTSGVEKRGIQSRNREYLHPDCRPGNHNSITAFVLDEWNLSEKKQNRS